jgi:hypothetical protein
MKIRRRPWLLGLLLIVLLVGGSAVAVFWPSPTDADQWTALVHTGVNHQDLVRLFGKAWEEKGYPKDKDGVIKRESTWHYPDGSTLTITFGPEREGKLNATSIQTTPAAPVHPLTRLRRTLARIFPFIGGG